MIALVGLIIDGHRRDDGNLLLIQEPCLCVIVALSLFSKPHAPSNLRSLTSYTSHPPLTHP